MDIDSNSMTSIDTHQVNLIVTLRDGHLENFQLLQKFENWPFILDENMSVYQKLRSVLKYLDSTCFWNLKQIQEKHCNTYEVMLKNVRGARTIKLAVTSLSVFKIEDTWSAIPLTYLFNLILFGYSEVHNATLLYTTTLVL